MTDTAPQLTIFATGQGVASAGWMNGLAQTCDNFAQLRGFIGITGAMVYARGQATVNDGLQGFFYWSATGTAPDDNTNVIIPTGSTTGAGEWVRSPFIASLTGITVTTGALFPNADGAVTLGNSGHQWLNIFTYGIDIKDPVSGFAVELNAPTLSFSYTFVLPTSQGTLGQFLVSGGSGQPAKWQTGGSPAFQQGQIGGLNMNGAGGFVNINEGYCVSDDITVFMRLPVGISKTTGSWAAGSGNGGLDIGTIAASSSYNVFVIQNPTSGATDALLSLSVGGPTLPAGYTKQRRIGAVLTDGGGNIILFTQNGNLFLLNTPVSVASTTIGTTATLLTLSPNIPLSGGVSGTVPIQAILMGSVSNASAAVQVIISDPAVADTAPSAGYNTAITQVAAQAQSLGRFEILVNSFSQVRARASANSTTINLYTCGWIDTRGFDG